MNERWNTIRPSIVVILVAIAVVFSCYFTWQIAKQIDLPTATPDPTGTSTPTGLISLPQTTPTLPGTATGTSTATPTPTATPYTLVLDGFFNCRAEPSALSESLFVIRGQQIIILEQNQKGDWIHVRVDGFDRLCWVSAATIPNLNMDAIARIPVEGIPLTFTLPPGTQTAPTHTGGKDDPPVQGPGATQPVQATNTTRPPDPSDTPKPPPTNTPKPPPTNTPKPPSKTPCPTNPSGNQPPGQCR